MASPDFNLQLAKERAAELEYQIHKMLPGIQKPETQRLLAEFLEEQKRSPRAASAQTLLNMWRGRYLRVPVSVREFISGRRYLNCPIGESGVYPKIVEGLENLFNHEYTEVILGGSIGWGKSTFGTLAVAYDLYKLSCLRDPATIYGMKTGSNMTFVNISVDKKQAEKVFFTDLYNLIKSSWYFTHVFPYDKSLKTEIRFPKNVRCYPVAASEQAALGVGVFCAFIDEVNFMDVIERSKRSTPGASNIYDQAEAVFNKLQYRMRSRMNLYGRLPGHIYAASSARYPDDFTERMAKRAKEEAEKGERNMLFLSYALWDTIPDSKISKETFPVEVGDLTRRTRVLTGEEENVNQVQVIRVPVDFKRAFERDPDLAVRDLAGKSVYSIKPFIQRRELIALMFQLGKEMGLKHPFSREQVTLQDRDPYLERLLPEHLPWIERQKTLPDGRPMYQNGEPVRERVLFPALYCAHMDLAKNGDSAGLAVGHIIGTRQCLRFDIKRLQDVPETKPVIRLDLVLRINPPRGGGEIDLPSIRAVLYQLQQLGMEFGMVSADTFGSQEGIKRMKDRGLNADIYSVDRDDNEAYTGLRDAIYDSRLFCYHYPTLERELAQLEDTGKKVDHPAVAGSSKDVADCVAAVVHHCEQGWRSGRHSQGLFQLGLVERAGELPEELQKQIANIYSRVAGQGQPLSDEDADKLMFSQFFHELFDDDKIGG